MASAHGKLDRLASFGVTGAGRRALAAPATLHSSADHAVDHVAHKGTDTQLAVLGAFVVPGKPFLDRDAIHNGASFLVIEIRWEPGGRTMGVGCIDGIHDTRQTGMSIHSDLGRTLGHVLGPDFVQVCHLLRVVPCRICQL